MALGLVVASRAPFWIMPALVTPAVAVIPAFQAENTIAQVLAELVDSWRRRRNDPPRVVVVDDGSTDRTGLLAERAGAHVVTHERNLGKGVALLSGLRYALECKARVAVTLDADGQHPAAEAVRLLEHEAAPQALLLGVRDLRAAGAPRANRFSNAFSNLWLSAFSGQKLLDTQCGLRRYPIAETLRLGARASGYGFESEVILRAARAGWSIAQEPVSVIYPPAGSHTSHFHSVRDPIRIALRIVYTAVSASRQ